MLNQTIKLINPILFTALYKTKCIILPIFFASIYFFIIFYFFFYLYVYGQTPGGYEHVRPLPRARFVLDHHDGARAGRGCPFWRVGEMSGWGTSRGGGAHFGIVRARTSTHMTKI